MDSCCSAKGCAVQQMRVRQASVLRRVLFINAGMFGVEFAAGIALASAALLADSLDMLGDALVYGFSLYVVARGERWKVRAALLKAGVMAGFGLFVVAELGYKLAAPVPPEPQPMGLVGVLALAANVVCFAMLWRHRGDDINMRSVWLCSRNDLIANSMVILAAAAVGHFGSAWPDIVVGAFICALFLRSAFVVTIESLEARRRFQSAAACTIGRL